MLSRVEFQPQWLQKPPTASCVNTSFCGAQFIMYPLSLTISLKSSGNIEPGLSTHKKGCLLLARSSAISLISLLVMEAMLPRLTYRTELRVCLSSHSMHLLSSSSFV
ncbi:hypothetical protein SLE2022_195400 [Rubroshorea leprosula]